MKKIKEKIKGWNALSICGDFVDIGMNVWIDLATRIRKANTFVEDGMVGCKDNDMIILPAVFDQIEILHNEDVIIRTGSRVYRFNVNGDGHCRRHQLQNDRFFQNGYVGWMGEDKVIIPAAYDNVVKCWGYDLYETVLNGEVRYFNGEGNEILTMRKEVLGLTPEEGYKESIYSLRTENNDNITFQEYCHADSHCDEIVKDGKGRSIRLYNFSHKEIMNLLTMRCTDLSISASDLDMFNDDCAYEFSGYIASSNKPDAIRDCIQQFQDFRVNDNTWYYIAKIITAPGQKRSAEELKMFRNYLEDIKPSAIGYVVGIGESEYLKEDEAMIVLITHYQDGGPSSSIRWCNTLEEVLADEKENLQRISKIKNRKRREAELQEIYAIPFVNIRYSEKRTWEETKKIFEYLCKKYPRFVNRGHHMLTELDYCWAYGKKEAIARIKFGESLLRWAATKGVNLNKIYRAQTVLDRLIATLNDDRECTKAWEVERKEAIRRLIPDLVAMGAKTLAQIRQEEDDTHTTYEDEVEKLRLLCESCL